MSKTATVFTAGLFGTSNRLRYAHYGSSTDIELLNSYAAAE